MDISPYSIYLSNKRRNCIQLNEEFHSLIKRINQILNQTEFDINNGEYIYREHCSEVRRQVQLAKETQILKIEEMADKLMKESLETVSKVNKETQVLNIEAIFDNLMNEIDEFEKESLETVSKVNKDQLVNKLNEMKQENEKWNQRLDEFKVDIQILNQLRNSLSKIAVERDIFNSLLHNKMLKFREYKDQSLVGELSQVTLDSFDKIFLKKHYEDLAKGYLLKKDLSITMSFVFEEGKILSNGDLLLCGDIRDGNGDHHDLVLAIFDLNKDFKLKKIKKLCVDYNSMATSSDKICINYLVKDRSNRYKAREETENDKEYQETNDMLFEFRVLILNENLEILHRYWSPKMILVGANDSFLFFDLFFGNVFWEDGKLSLFSWSMEYVKTIGQSADPNLPFCFRFYNAPKRKFVNMFERYYFIDNSQKFRIVDEETGFLLKAIDDTSDFCFDNNYNIILAHNDSIKYLSFNGDFLREIKMKYKMKNYKYFFLFNYDKSCCGVDGLDRLLFWNRYDEKTHEVI